MAGGMNVLPVEGDVTVVWLSDNSVEFYHVAYPSARVLCSSSCLMLKTLLRFLLFLG